MVRIVRTSRDRRRQQRRRRRLEQRVHLHQRGRERGVPVVAVDQRGRRHQAGGELARGQLPDAVAIRVVGIGLAAVAVDAGTIEERALDEVGRHAVGRIDGGADRDRHLAAAAADGDRELHDRRADRKAARVGVERQAQAHVPALAPQHRRQRADDVAEPAGVRPGHRLGGEPEHDRIARRAARADWGWAWCVVGRRWGSERGRSRDGACWSVLEVAVSLRAVAPSSAALRAPASPQPSRARPFWRASRRPRFFARPSLCAADASFRFAGTDIGRAGGFFFFEAGTDFFFVGLRPGGLRFTRRSPRRRWPPRKTRAAR